MVAVLALMLLVPLPKQPANPVVGEWSIQWGACQQTTWFAADGTCDSCRFGAGEWSTATEDGIVTIWFSERAGVYAVAFDPITGIGQGYTVHGERVSPAAEVVMRRVSIEGRKPKEGKE